MEHIRISSAAYTLTGKESFVNAFGTANVYLPARGVNPVTIRKGDTGSTAVTINPASGESIEYAAGGSLTLSYQGDYATLYPVYGGWVVTDSYTQRPSLVNPTITGAGSAVFSKLNPVAATGVLTISNVVKDGETVTICEDVYEFCADAAQSLTDGSTVAVDIEAKTTKASNTLTIAVNPTAAETIVIGPSGDTTTYTFVAAANFDTAGEIPLGTSAAATQANIVAAINGTDGVNDPDQYVSIGAFNASNVATVTALVGGTVGNSIGTTDTMANVGNVFSDSTLGNGADCSAANAVTALVAAINGAGNVTAAAGANDTVTLTATPGAAGNAIATTENMSAGAFSSATLVGGSDQGMASPLFTNMTHEVTVNTHDYDNGVADWTLTAAEQLMPFHKVIKASGGVDAVIPLSPSIPYTFINASGQVLTVKGASGTSVNISNAKTATVMSDGTNVIRLTLDA